MTHKQNVFHQNEISSAITRILKKVSDSSICVTKSGKFVSLEKKNGIVIHSKLQYLFGLKFESDLDQAIFDIIVESCVAAEKMGPGGFDECFENVIRKFFSMDDRKLSSESTSDFLNMISTHGATVPTESDIPWLMTSFLSDKSKMISSMFEKAVELSGFSGKIAIEKTSNNPCVELVHGYTFEHEPVWQASTQYHNPKIICLDGFVESVSQLNHVLEEASRTKETVFFFSRGLAEEVKNTLKINYDRGTLRVIPIIVKFDLQGINTLNDIAVIAGTDVYSTNNGAVINNIKLEDAKRVEKIVLQSDKFVIFNSEYAYSVKVHVNNLFMKRESLTIEDVSDLIDKRIRSLTPSYVVIRINDDKDFVSNSQSFDYAIRALKALTDKGTIEINNVKKLTTTVIASEIFSQKCIKMIRNLGCVIISQPEHQQELESH